MSSTSTASAATAATSPGVSDEVNGQRHSIGNCPPRRCGVRLLSMPPDNYRQGGEQDDPAREMRAAGRPPAADLGPAGIDGDALPQARRTGFDPRLVHLPRDANTQVSRGLRPVPWSS